ncbi:hypothetical protein [Sphingomonas profundi]|nr:hypothetical protein [Sphingomonas profundi]
MTIVSGPIALLASLPAAWMRMDSLSDPAWLNHLTACADRICRAPA